MGKWKKWMFMEACCHLSPDIWKNQLLWDKFCSICMTVPFFFVEKRVKDLEDTKRQSLKKRKEKVMEVDKRQAKTFSIPFSILQKNQAKPPKKHSHSSLLKTFHNFITKKERNNNILFFSIISPLFLFLFPCFFLYLR